MTGELSLTGQVLPLGGLREKTVAARRNGIKTILIPKANVRDLADIPDHVKAGITFIPVTRAEDVMLHAFSGNGKTASADETPTVKKGAAKTSARTERAVKNASGKTIEKKSAPKKSAAKKEGVRREKSAAEKGAPKAKPSAVKKGAGKSRKGK